MITVHAFISGLKKGGEIPPYLVLSGSEEFLRSQVFEAVTGSLADGEFDVIRVDWQEGDGDESALIEIFDELRTASLFGSFKILRVVGARSFLLDNKDSLVSFVKNETPVGLLVVEGDEIVGKKTPQGISTVLQAMADAGSAVVDCSPPKSKNYGYGRAWWDTELTGWVMERVEGAGKTIDPEVAHALHSSVGGGLRGLAGQIDKLVVHVGDNGGIQAEDVTQLVGDTRQATAFELVDCVLLRNLEDAVRTSTTLFRTGLSERGKVVLDPMELAMRSSALIGLRVRELGRIVESQRQGRSFEEAASEVLGGHRKWLFGRYREQLNANSPRDLGNLLVSLADLDEDLKTSAGDPRTLLNSLVVTHCRRRNLVGEGHA